MSTLLANSRSNPPRTYHLNNRFLNSTAGVPKSLRHKKTVSRTVVTVVEDGSFRSMDSAPVLVRFSTEIIILLSDPGPEKLGTYDEQDKRRKAQIGLKRIPFATPLLLGSNSISPIPGVSEVKETVKKSIFEVH